MARAKAKYAAARKDIADAVSKGRQIDLTAAVANAEAEYAADIDDCLSDGSEGLEDLLGETTDD